jgi:hypothetical protein
VPPTAVPLGAGLTIRASYMFPWVRSVRVLTPLEDQGATAPIVDIKLCLGTRIIELKWGPGRLAQANYCLRA